MSRAIKALMLLALPCDYIRRHDDDPRLMSVAMLAALPVVLAYLIFQRRVTEAVMISSGVKG